VPGLRFGPLARKHLVSTDRWGIADGYYDQAGVWHATSAETRRVLLEAMNLGPADVEPRSEPILVVRQGDPQPVAGPAELVLENGGSMAIEGRLPPDLPPGYHRLRSTLDDTATLVIVSPGTCHLPPAARIWGWAVQLYAARSAGSWGIGDLADLRRLAQWSQALGAGILLINPLHATWPFLPQQASPYSPSSRRYLNPLYLRVEEVPGAAEARLDLEGLAAAGRALSRERLIDRDAVFKLKMRALELLWSRFNGDPGFERYRAAHGGALTDFATYSALAEHYASGWQAWPAEYRRPDSGAVQRFRVEHADRVRLHEWVQWLLDEQRARAGRGIAVMQDLPIGVHPDGADAWVWQDFLAAGVHVGAPPDTFNRLGQDWGLPPFIPSRLRAAGYGPFIETIRAVLRHGGGLRLDHVMGLFRLFWIPVGLGAAHGAYVRYAADELLAILALESHRGSAYVLGEDLGTLEAGVRERLAEYCLFSYRLLYFETDPPATYPRQALAAVTNHDLPTIAGLWTGADLRSQRDLGLMPNDAAWRAIRDQICGMAGVTTDAPVEQVIEAAYRALAQAPSVFVTATLEDALAVEERPNMPGTTTEWPNWCLALPAPLETLEHHPLARAVATALGGRDANVPGSGPAC
jgi:4-alpha-glucanotransferase